ncbi:MAG TPA: hypothetical protein PK987_02325 [Ferruginibacter sp.]|nr:hypothetical protein [Ferruginibacter sp.]
MKKILPIVFIVLLSQLVFAQNFTGQWKGEFVDKSSSFTGWGGDHCEYVLEIECKGTKVTGYSYTYFSDGGKRYYTICQLTGKLNKASKYIEVTEIKRTKTNVPVNIRNCFQIHKLTYFKQGDSEKLEGTWVPAPNQQGDCGFGTTVLSRRLLQNTPGYYSSKSKQKVPVAKVKTQKTTTPVTKAKPPIKKTAPVASTKAPVLKQIPDKLNTEDAKPPEEIKTDKTEPIVKKPVSTKFEKRNSDVIKTIEIDNKTFTVDLYDNGEIDGDSISLFFNGKLLLSHKRLSDKAISLKLNIDEAIDMNELIMYAENLGTIPPNTALMIVHDGDNRYEVRISSDLQKSGAIRFVHKPDNKQ